MYSPSHSPGRNCCCSLALFIILTWRFLDENIWLAVLKMRLSNKCQWYFQQALSFYVYSKVCFHSSLRSRGVMISISAQVVPVSWVQSPKHWLKENRLTTRGTQPYCLRLIWSHSVFYLFFCTYTHMKINNTQVQQNNCQYDVILQSQCTVYQMQ